MSKKTPDELSIPYEAKRIYNWQHSQLSIARHYGGIRLNGVEYAIRYDLEGQPLEQVVAKPKQRKPKKKESNETDQTVLALHNTPDDEL